MKCKGFGGNDGISNSAGRSHALLSPSSAHRWMNCTPSAVLETEFSDRAGQAAEEGTAAHALCEHKLKKALRRRSRRPVSPYDSDEMEECAEAYVDFVLEQLEEVRKECADPLVLIEQRVDFTALWQDMDQAVKACVRQRVPMETHGLRFFWQSGFLFLVLPSGKKLAYVKPRIGENRFGGESITYEGGGKHEEMGEAGKLWGEADRERGAGHCAGHPCLCYGDASPL